MAHCWVVLVVMVLKQCCLNTPLWRLADLVSRAHRSARFHKNSSLIALQQFPLKSFPWIVDVTHQFSLDKLGPSTRVHSVQHVHAPPDYFPRPRSCSRYRSCSPCLDSSLDRAQLSCLAGVCPSFLRSSVLSPVFTRVSVFTSFVPTSALFSGLTTLWIWMFRRLTWC